MEEYDVFISYSRKDSKTVNKICEIFDQSNIKYFIDRQGIGGGYEFPKVLAKAIVNSRLFLFIASKNSYESKFTNSEVTFAFNKKSKDSIIPYIIDDSKLPIELDFVFSSVNRRNIKEHPINTVLVNDILKLLNREETTNNDYNRKPDKTPQKINKYFLCIIASIAILSAIWINNSNQGEGLEWLGYTFIFISLLSFVLAIIGLIKPTTVSCSDRKEIILLIVIPMFFVMTAGCLLLPDKTSGNERKISTNFRCTAEQRKIINQILENMVLVQGVANSFYISRTEVTAYEWEVIMGKRPGDTLGNYPANNITEESCNAFIEKISDLSGIPFSIPTTQEWIIAAKGGNSRSYERYPGSDSLDLVAWYTENSNNLFHPVGTKSPNALGIYDMAGNVWEMCYDEAMGYYTQRGGSINSESYMCQISDSSGDSIAIDPYECGLRLVMKTGKLSQ